MTRESQRFDRVPQTDVDAVDAGGGVDSTGGDVDGTGGGVDSADDAEVPPSREAILTFFEERYGVPPGTFAGHTFWERGKGKLWAFRGEVDSPVAIEGLGMSLLRTRGEHWKPTTDGVQRFGRHATRNVIELERAEAATFVAGEDQEVPWDGDWGYLIVAHEFVGGLEPLGVGLYLRGELRSQVPKGRRRTLE